MPSEKEWTEVLRKLVKQTEEGQLNWDPTMIPSSIRDNVVGDAIYCAPVAGQILIVYEYKYRLYTDEDRWTEDTDVAIEFVDAHGNLKWQLPKLPYRLQLLDAIRYRLSGAREFLRHFL